MLVGRELGCSVGCSVVGGACVVVGASVGSGSVVAGSVGSGSLVWPVGSGAEVVGSVLGGADVVGASDEGASLLGAAEVLGGADDGSGEVLCGACDSLPTLTHAGSAKGWFGLPSMATFMNAAHVRAG